MIKVLPLFFLAISCSGNFSLTKKDDSNSLSSTTSPSSSNQSLEFVVNSSSIVFGINDSISEFQITPPAGSTVSEWPETINLTNPNGSPNTATHQGNGVYSVTNPAAMGNGSLTIEEGTEFTLLTDGVESVEPLTGEIAIHIPIIKMGSMILSDNSSDGNNLIEFLKTSENPNPSLPNTPYPILISDYTLKLPDGSEIINPTPDTELAESCAVSTATTRLAAIDERGLASEQSALFCVDGAGNIVPVWITAMMTAHTGYTVTFTLARKQSAPEIATKMEMFVDGISVAEVDNSAAVSGVIADDNIGSLRTSTFDYTFPGVGQYEVVIGMSTSTTFPTIDINNLATGINHKFIVTIE